MTAVLVVTVILLLGTVAALDCSGPLATTSSGPDNTCPDKGSYHYWPVGGPITDCHGWQALANGKIHDNAANNIRFSSDGKKLMYDQFAGGLDCSGTATSKEFVLGECHQGIPPKLYDTGVNFACAEVSSDGCKAISGVPRVESASTTEEKIFKNNVLCDAAAAAAASTGSTNSGAEHIVTDKNGVKQWTASAGTYASITAAVNDKITFNFNGGHDVVKMSDGTCGATGNTELAKKNVGGGVTGANGLTNKFTYTITAADVTAGSITFACSEPTSSYGHCNAGQKLTVKTGATATTAGAAATGLTGGTSSSSTTIAATATILLLLQM